MSEGPSDVSAAILVGGQARRFGGRDKSRLVVRGQPIIVRQLAVLQQVATEVFLVGSTGGRFAEAGVPVHADLIPDGGALGGLLTALTVAANRHVIAVACDLPFLEAAVLARLVELARGFDAAWVRGARGPEPFVACYDRGSREAVAALLATGTRRVGDLEGVLRIAWLDGPELVRLGASEAVLTNLNTPDDYARVQ